ncbi:hypothetical protein [Caulobacter segnis]|nr:hypothetical protein [Caulobacter segnis]
MALTSIVTDLVQAIERAAPGLLDKTLAIARIRAQMLDRGEPEVVPGEPMVQAHKIRLLELALGRTPTIS